MHPTQERLKSVRRALEEAVEILRTQTEDDLLQALLSRYAERHPFALLCSQEFALASGHLGAQH